MGDLFSRIATEVISLSEQITEVSSSIEKIASGNLSLVTSIDEIEQISSANIDEAGRVSDSSAQQVESIQAITLASHDLAELAADLMEATEKFNI